MRKLKRQYKVKNVPEKTLPAIADGAVCEKETRGRAELRWDSVVERAWKCMVANQEDMVSVRVDKFGRYNTDVKGGIERRERLALRNKVKSKRHFELCLGVNEGNRNENVFARPNGLPKTLKLRFR